MHKVGGLIGFSLLIMAPGNALRKISEQGNVNTTIIFRFFMITYFFAQDAVTDGNRPIMITLSFVGLLWIGLLTGKMLHFYRPVMAAATAARANSLYTDFMLITLIIVLWCANLYKISRQSKLFLCQESENQRIFLLMNISLRYRIKN